jgi:hypothetical protein
MDENKAIPPLYPVCFALDFLKEARRMHKEGIIGFRTLRMYERDYGRDFTKWYLREFPGTGAYWEQPVEMN